MKHKLRIARATEKHATLLYKTGKKTIEVTQDLSHKTNILLKDGLETKGIDKEIYMPDHQGGFPYGYRTFHIQVRLPQGNIQGY